MKDPTVKMGSEILKQGIQSWSVVLSKICKQKFSHREPSVYLKQFCYGSRLGFKFVL